MWTQAEFEFGYRRRFCDDACEAGAAQLADDRRIDLGAGGDSDRGDAMLAQCRKQFGTAKIRHATVEQEQIKWPRLSLGERACAVGDGDDVTAHLGKCRVEIAQAYRVVVGDQDSRHKGLLAGRWLAE
jgi:hypothetical protein